MMWDMPAWTIAILDVEERVSDEQRAGAAIVVNMTLAAAFVQGISSHEKRAAFRVTLELLQRLVEQRELSASLLAVFESADVNWTKAPEILRTRVETIREAYRERRRREGL